MATKMSVSSVHIHVDTPEHSSHHSSFDLLTIPTKLSTRKDLLNTPTLNSSSPSFDVQRGARFSNLSSSYALFLKQRDTDKTKKIVSLQINVSQL